MGCFKLFWPCLGLKDLANKKPMVTHGTSVQRGMTMNRSSPGQLTCDLCKVPFDIPTNFDGKVSRSEMEIIARNGFGKKAAGFQNIEPSRRKEEFLSFVVRSHIDSWWLCPRCFETALTYRWTYQLYQFWLKDKLLAAGGILGGIGGMCAGVIIFAPPEAVGWADCLTRAVVLAVAAAIFLALAGAFVGYVVGSIIDFVRINFLGKGDQL